MKLLKVIQGGGREACLDGTGWNVEPEIVEVQTTARSLVGGKDAGDDGDTGTLPADGHEITTVEIKRGRQPEMAPP
jgi:hypothetical protein